jgi:prepilin-type N-terminal cleavage/methylation domain-containing protein
MRTADGVLFSMKKTKMAGTTRRQKGFTLLEVIVALSLIAIAMLAVIPLLIQAFSVDNETVYRVKAQSLAAQRVDDLISRSSTTNTDAYGNLICNGITYTEYVDERSGLVSTVNSGAPTVITRSWVLVPSPTSSATYPLCLITVTTSYTYKGNPKSYQLVSESGE